MSLDELAGPVGGAARLRQHGEPPAPSLQFGDQVRHAAIAVGGVRRASLGDHRPQVGVSRLSDQSVQHHAQGEHVIGHDRLGARHSGRTGEPLRHGGQHAARRLVHQPGDAKIQQSHPAAAVHHQVGRLQIGVNDQMFMGKLHRPGRLQQKLDLPPFGQTLGGGVDGAAIDIFHHQIRRAGGNYAPVDQPGDPRMLQPGQQPALLGEAVAGQMHEVAMQELDRHDLVEQTVIALTLPNLPHAAFAQQLGQSKGADLFGGRR